MIGFSEACFRIAELTERTPTKTVALGDAAGHVLATPVIAMVDSPRQDVSTMDGYAVRDADLSNLPVSLAITAEIFPGQAELPRACERCCARIFTGAAVPKGYDRVIMQEVVQRDDERAVINALPDRDIRHIRLKGSDFRIGDTLLDRGTRLDPRKLVTAAAADVATLEVHCRPTVAILGTGDELVEPGKARDHPATMPESLSFGVAAMAKAWGGKCVSKRLLPDEPAALASEASAALASADVVVVTGGASVGERDYAKAMFGVDLELIFSKVAIKPGKPVWLGRTAGKVVLGLPGNPTSAMVTARLFLAPLLLRLSGAATEEALEWRTAELMSSLEATGDREAFIRARWSGERVEPLENQDSGAQHALALADLLIRRPRNSAAMEAGERVEIIDF